MANQAAFNERAETQRTNQAKENFKNFNPAIERKSAGLELGAQPKTSSIIRKNADGTYGTFVSEEEQLKQQGYINPSPEDAMETRPEVLKQMYIQNQYKDSVPKSYLTRASGPGALMDYVYRPITNDYIHKDDADEFFGREFKGKGSLRYQKEPDGGVMRTERGPFLSLPRIFRDKTTTDADRTKAGLTAYNSRKEGDLGPEGVGVYTGKPAPTLKSLRDELSLIKDMVDGPIKRSKLEEFKDNLPEEFSKQIKQVTVPGKYYWSTDKEEMVNPELVKEIENITKTLEPDMTKIVKYFQNIPLTEASDTVRIAVKARNEIVRLANIATYEGNRKEFELQKAKLAALDNGIVLAQGKQGLDDLDVGDTRRLSAALSNSLGRNVQITPRDDGLFTVTGLTSETQTRTADEIKTIARPIFDKEYEKNLTKIAFNRADELFKNELAIKLKLIEGKVSYEQAIAVEKIKAEAELKKEGYTVSKVDAGTLIQKDGAIGLLDVKEVEGPEGKTIEQWYIRPINPGELGSGLGLKAYTDELPVPVVKEQSAGLKHGNHMGYIARPPNTK